MIPFRISQEDYEKFTSEIPKKTPVAKVEKIREYWGNMSEGKSFKCKGETKLREIGLDPYGKLCEGCLDYIQTKKTFEIFYKLHGIDNGKLEEMGVSVDGEKYYAKCPLAKK